MVALLSRSDRGSNCDEVRIVRWSQLLLTVRMMLTSRLQQQPQPQPQRRLANRSITRRRRVRHSEYFDPLTSRNPVLLTHVSGQDNGVKVLWRKIHRQSHHLPRSDRRSSLFLLNNLINLSLRRANRRAVWERNPPPSIAIAPKSNENQGAWSAPYGRAVYWMSIKCGDDIGIRNAQTLRHYRARATLIFDLWTQNHFHARLPQGHHKYQILWLYHILTVRYWSGIYVPPYVCLSVRPVLFLNGCIHRETLLSYMPGRPVILEFRNQRSLQNFETTASTRAFPTGCRNSCFRLNSPFTPVTV